MLKMNVYKLLKWKFLVISFIAAIVISLNLTFVQSVIIGACASILYIIANGYILGTLFFEEEKVMLKTALGALLLLILLGLISLPFAIFYRLGAIEVTVLLLVGCAFNLLGDTYARRKASKTTQRRERPLKN